ncbi:hypothetical protein VTO73DRAFT_2038 [Trametes versicolor]
MSTGVGEEPGGPLAFNARDLPIFTDGVARATQLSPVYRTELHAFTDKLVMDLPPSFWRVIIYQQATIFKSLQSCSELRDDIIGIKDDIKVVSTQFSKNFVLTVEQRDDILALCKALVVEGTRTDYNFADSALAMLRNDKEFPRFVEVFKSKANTKVTLQCVRRQGSYGRNSYRQHLRDSVYDPRKKSGLTACAQLVSRKFLDGDKPSVEMTLRIAVLREFIRRNPELVAREEDPWDADPEQQDATADSPSTEGSRKRKRSRHTVHFWGAFTDFIQEKNLEWGTDIRSDGWQSHIEACLAEERRLWPDDPLSGIPQRQLPAPAALPPTSRLGAALAGQNMGGLSGLSGLGLTVPSTSFDFVAPDPRSPTASFSNSYDPGMQSPPSPSHRGDVYDNTPDRRAASRASGVAPVPTSAHTAGRRSLSPASSASQYDGGASSVSPSFSPLRRIPELEQPTVLDTPAPLPASHRHRHASPQVHHNAPPRLPPPSSIVQHAAPPGAYTVGVPSGLGGAFGVHRYPHSGDDSSGIHASGMHTYPGSQASDSTPTPSSQGALRMTGVPQPRPYASSSTYATPRRPTYAA